MHITSASAILEILPMKLVVMCAQESIYKVIRHYLKWKQNNKSLIDDHLNNDGFHYRGYVWLFLKLDRAYCTDVQLSVI